MQWTVDQEHATKIFLSCFKRQPWFSENAKTSGRVASSSFSGLSRDRLDPPSASCLTLFCVAVHCSCFREACLMSLILASLGLCYHGHFYLKNGMTSVVLTTAEGKT